MLTQQNIQKALGLVSSAFRGAGGVAPVSATQNINIGAYGPAFAAAGGIVMSPTLTVTGEGGPEAIIPLDRWGELGGGGVTVNIIDQRKSGNVEQRESTGAGGQPQIDVLITDVVKGGIGGGVFDQALAGSFGLSRRGTAR